MKKKITRRDIANLAGTSVSVVSRALNRSGYVEEEKRHNILKIAKELNYIPNSVIMTLQETKTKQIVFFCNDFKNPFYIQMYQGMLEEAKEKGYRILLDGNVEFDDIKSVMTDGIIVPNQKIAEYYTENYGKNYDIPVVCAAYSDIVQTSKSITMIEVDMFKTMQKGLNYFWSKGHRSIAYATPYDNGDSSREVAYVEWMQKNGLNPNDYLFKIPYVKSKDIPQFDFHALGRLAAYEYSKRELKPTGIIAFNDEYAYGMIEGFLEQKISIPDTVSIMGIDGTYTRQYMNPKLTTLSLSPEKQGALCVDVLIDIIEHRKHKYVTRITPRIIEGETVL